MTPHPINSETIGSVTTSFRRTKTRRGLAVGSSFGPSRSSRSRADRSDKPVGRSIRLILKRYPSLIPQSVIGVANDSVALGDPAQHLCFVFVSMADFNLAQDCVFSAHDEDGPRFSCSEQSADRDFQDTGRRPR